MKFLLLIAAIASVRAEADPAFTYATGYHLPYAYGAPLAHAPLTYTAAAAPVVTYAHAPIVYTAAAGCQNEAGAVVPCAHGGVLPFGLVPAAVAPAAEAAPAVEEARKKREAEATAEAEADPEAEAEAWIFYRSHGYWPHGYGHLAYSYAPYAYSGHYGYYGLGHHYGYYGRKKREATAEADADASPEADPWLLYGGYGHGLAYGGYYGYGYHHTPYAYLGGCRNYLGGLVPCAAGR
jgi:hypothetical protein